MQGIERVQAVLRAQNLGAGAFSRADGGAFTGDRQEALRAGTSLWVRHPSQLKFERGAGEQGPAFLFGSLANRQHGFGFQMDAPLRLIVKGPIQATGIQIKAGHGVADEKALLFTHPDASRTLGEIAARLFLGRGGIKVFHIGHVRAVGDLFDGALL
jgi:hypothetical protein